MINKYFFLILIGIFLISLSSSAELDGSLVEYYNGTATETCCIWGQFSEGNSFTIGTLTDNITYNLTGVSLKLVRVGTVPAMTVSIYETNATFFPITLLTTNSTFTPSDIATGSGDWYNFTFPDNLELDAGGKYAFIVNTSGTSDSNSLRLFINSSNEYSGGQRVSGDASGFNTINTGQDFNFEIYGIGEIIPTLTLDSPEDGSVFSTSSINFTTSGNNISSLNYNWTNLTYYVWHQNGSIFNSTFVDITDIDEFNDTLVISNFESGYYTWNVQGCFGNSSLTNCYFSESNNTFQWRPFEIDGQDYTSFVYETDLENYYLNITTIEDILSVTTKLNYNGTDYNADTTCVSGVCNISASIDVPLVNITESVNYTFYWKVTLFDGTQSFEFNTSDESLEQNVTRIHLEVCDGTYTQKTLNFSAYQETNLSRVDPFYIAGTFDTWLGSGDVKRNQSFEDNSATTLELCLTPTNRVQYTNAQIEYSYNDENITYVARNYYFQNASLDNVTQNIPLYLLEAADSTTFIIKVQDQQLASVDDALVYIQRYYPSLGTYKTVQIAKTDENGETVGFYQTETVDYKHIITKDGSILLETTQQKVVGKEVPFTLTFTTGSSLAYPWSYFQKDSNIQSNLTYNKTSKIITFTYIDTSGSITSARLLVLKQSNSNSTSTTICDTSSTQSAASITCNLTDYEGSFVAYGYLESEVTDLIDIIISTAREVFGREGLFLGLFIILTAAFAFIWNPSAGIIAINMAVIFTNLIGFISLSPVFIFGLIAVSILTIILMRT